MKEEYREREHFNAIALNCSGSVLSPFMVFCSQFSSLSFSLFIYSFLPCVTTPTSDVSTLKKHAVKKNYILCILSIWCQQRNQALTVGTLAGSRGHLLYACSPNGAIWNVTTRWQQHAILIEPVYFLWRSFVLKWEFTQYYCISRGASYLSKRNVDELNCSVFAFSFLVCSYFWFHLICLWSFGASRMFHNVVCMPEGEVWVSFASVLADLSMVRCCWHHSLCDGRNGQVEGTIFFGALYTILAVKKKENGFEFFTQKQELWLHSLGQKKVKSRAQTHMRGNRGGT